MTSIQHGCVYFDKRHIYILYTQQQQPPSIQAYAPPEAVFAGSWVLPTPNTHGPHPSYDVWSTGVVALQLLMGNPGVFQVPAHTRNAVLRSVAAATLRTQHGMGHEETTRMTDAQALLLRGMLELCILPPQLDPFTRAGGALVHELQWSCSDAALLLVLRARDPTGRGPPGGRLGVRLLRAMLAWEAEARPTTSMALRHALFGVPEGMLEHDVTCDEALGAVGDKDGWWC